MNNLDYTKLKHDLKSDICSIMAALKVVETNGFENEQTQLIVKCIPEKEMDMLENLSKLSQIAGKQIRLAE